MLLIHSYTCICGQSINWREILPKPHLNLDDVIPLRRMSWPISDLLALIFLLIQSNLSKILNQRQLMTPASTNDNSPNHRKTNIDCPPNLRPDHTK